MRDFRNELTHLYSTDSQRSCKKHAAEKRQSLQLMVLGLHIISGGQTLVPYFSLCAKSPSKELKSNYKTPDSENINTKGKDTGKTPRYWYRP